MKHSLRLFDIDYTHKKQSGGSGQFGRVKINFDPLEPGSGIDFENSVVGGNVPKEYIPGVEKGIRTMAKQVFWPVSRSSISRLSFMMVLTMMLTPL